MSKNEVPSISGLKCAKRETLVNDELIARINAVARELPDETNLIDLYLTKMPTAYDSNRRIIRNEAPPEWKKLLKELELEDYNKRGQLIKMIGSALKAGYGNVDSIRVLPFESLVRGRQMRTFFDFSPRDAQATLPLEPVTCSFLKGVFDKKS